MSAGGWPAEALIADDEPIACDILQLYLENFGFRVQVAKDGDEALAIYRDCADWIGLVVLDARMPGPPPLALYRLIREISPLVPVLFCSGVSPDDPELQRINEHGLQLLPKPFKRYDLYDAMRKVLGATQEHGASRSYRPPELCRPVPLEREHGT